MVKGQLLVDINTINNMPILRLQNQISTHSLTRRKQVLSKCIKRIKAFIIYIIVFKRSKDYNDGDRYDIKKKKKIRETNSKVLIFLDLACSFY